jgi:hypothetical protein
MSFHRNAKLGLAGRLALVRATRKPRYDGTASREQDPDDDDDDDEKLV